MLRVGTRSSRLALAQTQEVISKLKRVDDRIEYEIVKIKTTGDLIDDRSLVDIGGKALFLKEIEESLLLGKIDIAVHSLKDVPAVLPDGLIIPAVTERLAPEDVFIASCSLADIPEDFVIGTCASRRKAFLLHHFGSRVKVVDIRGNLDTRLEKLTRGAVEGLILAKAGLERLGIKSGWEVIPTNVMLPAIGQGAIAIECKEERDDLISLLQTINHDESFLCTTAERAFMLEMGGVVKLLLQASQNFKVEL